MAFGHTHQYFVRGSRSMVYEEYVDKIHILKKHQGMFDLVSTELYVSTAINDNKIIELMYWPLAADIFTQYSPTQILLGPSIISQQGCHYVQALARLALRLAGASWALNAPEDYRNRTFGPATGGRIVESCDLDEWTHSRMSGIVRLEEKRKTRYCEIFGISPINFPSHANRPQPRRRRVTAQQENDIIGMLANMYMKATQPISTGGSSESEGGRGIARRCKSIFVPDAGSRRRQAVLPFFRVPGINPQWLIQKPASVFSPGRIRIVQSPAEPPRVPTATPVGSFMRTYSLELTNIRIHHRPRIYGQGHAPQAAPATPSKERLNAHPYLSIAAARMLSSAQILYI
ncbi:hypothetical protein C8J57DRAFT_1477715 [Mycena rebaudengoi]|nr:hypothetical protein C8J57DRAFT_1477715 [Mycena rebaudengoi]